MGERCHNIPKYLHGSGDSTNVTPDVPLEYHAFQHYLIADSAMDEDTKKANMWAVNHIIARSSKEEQDATHKLIHLHNEDKKKGVK